VMNRDITSAIGNSDRSKGFTLIEILLAMAIGVIVLAAIYAATTAGQQASAGIEQKISAQQDVRAALDIMAGEISMASFNPLAADDNGWRNNLCVAGGVTTSRGIQSASANQLSIQMDRQENNNIGLDTNEIITYTFVNNSITRETNCGGAQAFLGDAGAPTNTARNVMVINDAAAISTFRYFKGDGTEITSPVLLPGEIRKIRITLAVQAAASDLQGQKRKLVYSSEVVPRNHALPPYR
jgi:prepilin-type N-terminal cleavage/methylation domain-containing protein